MPNVLIVLVNWNSANHTIECLESLTSLVYPRFSIAIVNNGSDDDSGPALKAYLSSHRFSFNVELIDHPINRGFAGGNNIAIDGKQTTFDAFWLLNNDTLVQPDTLSQLVERMESDPRVGIVGSKIYFAGSNVIWYAGGRVSHWTGRGRGRGKGEIDHGQYDQAQETDYVTGCSLLVRREVVETVGLMREDYFLYYEETEWNLRAARAGWQLWYEPGSIVHHKVGMATREGARNSPMLIYYNLRNRFTMMQRVGSPSQRLTSLVHLHAQLGIQTRAIIRRRYKARESLWYLLRGYVDAITRSLGPAPEYRFPRGHRKGFH